MRSTRARGPSERSIALCQEQPQQSMHVTHVGTPPNRPSIARHTVIVSTLPQQHTLTHIAVLRSHATQYTDTGTNVRSGGRVGTERWAPEDLVTRPKMQRTKMQFRCSPDVTAILSPRLNGFIGRQARSAAPPAAHRLWSLRDLPQCALSTEVAALEAKV